MPNGRRHLKYKDFGKHEYESHSGTSNCKHDCGCWVGPARSGATYYGVSPFGRCPGNILADVPDLNGLINLTTDMILEDFVNGRIEHLEAEVRRLQTFEIIVSESKKGERTSLVIELKKYKDETIKLKRVIDNMVDGIKGELFKVKV